jgi:hypothetical protein
LSSHGTPVPDALPVLSRGRHRSPRSGACFMEMASYLAGERWSDHPACTHPLLAAVARRVNDYTTDAGRTRLAALIPSVIGLTTDDPRADVGIALLCATTALPRVASEHQRVLAVSILTCENVLAGLEPPPTAPGTTGPQPGDAAVSGRLASSPPVSGRLASSPPEATAWAHGFVQRIKTSPRGFRRHAAPGTVRYAVDSLARAGLPDSDDVLYDLLVAAIAECSRHVRQTPTIPAGAPDWAAACALTRRKAGRA